MVFVHKAFHYYDYEWTLEDLFSALSKTFNYILIKIFIFCSINTINLSFCICIYICVCISSVSVHFNFIFKYMSGTMSTILSTLQGSELNVYVRQEFEGKKVTQICYLCIFLMFYVRGESEARRDMEERKNKAKNMETKEE